jgi:O-antigen/teichoic acid export membrane protein
VVALVALTSSDSVAAAAALVAAASLLARAFDSPEIWYRSHMQSRVVAVRRLIVTLLFFALRIVAILVYPDLWVFIALFVVEALSGSALVFLRYLRDPGTPGLSRPSLSLAWKLIRQSWPLLVSGVANQANLRSDVIVIQAVLGASAVGVYSAAARMSELAFFIPVVFMNATLPLLLKARNGAGSSPGVYRSALQRSYDYAFWLGVLVAAVTGGVGTFIITTFFSGAYSQSVGLLWILVIACPFVFMAAVYSKWIIAEGYLWASVTRHGIGAAANIGLNISLLPVFGIEAAAISTVCSYIVASYIACFIGRRSRVAGVQMTLALIAPGRLIVGWFQEHRDKSRRTAPREGN